MKEIYKMIVLSAFLLISFQKAEQKDPLVTEVWSIDLLNSSVTVGEVSDICYNGAFILFDDQTGKLLSINKENAEPDLITTFSKGSGPGEYQSVQSIVCDESSVYLLDYRHFKILTYHLKNGEIEENSVDTYLNWLSKLVRLDGEFFVNNYDPENHFFYTRLNDGVKFIQPFREGEVPRHAIMAMEQLTQSSLIYHNKHYYHFLSAPYRITKLGRNFEVIKTIEDERSVVPWQDHIFVNEVGYRVDRYPILTGCFRANNFAICEFNMFEENNSYIDFWKLPDVEKVVSIKNDPEFFISHALPGQSKDEFYLLFINHNTLKVKMLSFKL